MVSSLQMKGCQIVMLWESDYIIDEEFRKRLLYLQWLIVSVSE